MSGAGKGKKQEEKAPSHSLPMHNTTVIAIGYSPGITRPFGPLLSPPCRSDRSRYILDWRVGRAKGERKKTGTRRVVVGVFFSSFLFVLRALSVGLGSRGAQQPAASRRRDTLAAKHMQGRGGKGQGRKAGESRTWGRPVRRVKKKKKSCDLLPCK